MGRGREPDACASKTDTGWTPLTEIPRGSDPQVRLTRQRGETAPCVRQCVRVLIGATAEGRKELMGFQAGFRESGRSWRDLLLDLNGRGLAFPPKPAVRDGALGFRKALDEVFPGTRRQRSRVHKTANVLTMLPKSRQRNAKHDLHQIWMAGSRAEAEKALDPFGAKCEAAYSRAVACLENKCKALLAFHDFPAEHWQQIRITNPIEGVCATVRHRTVRT